MTSLFGMGMETIAVMIVAIWLLFYDGLATLGA